MIALIFTFSIPCPNKAKSPLAWSSGKTFIMAPVNIDELGLEQDEDRRTLPWW